MAASEDLRLFRVGVHQVQPDAGLDVDEGDVVADHVVQVAGDAQAFLAGPALVVKGAGGFGFGHVFQVQAPDFRYDDQDQ